MQKGKEKLENGHPTSFPLTFPPLQSILPNAALSVLPGVNGRIGMLPFDVDGIPSIAPNGLNLGEGATVPELSNLHVDDSRRKEEDNDKDDSEDEVVLVPSAERVEASIRRRSVC